MHDNKEMKLIKVASPKAIQDYLVKENVPAFKVFIDDTVKIYQPDIHFNHFKAKNLQLLFPTDEEKVLESLYTKILLESFDVKKHFAYPPSKSLGYYMAVKTYDFIVYCDAPRVCLNDKKQPHSLTGKAIEFEDGWGLNYINGVYFNEELYNKVINNQLTQEEIQQIPDINQRKEVISLTIK